MAGKTDEQTLLEYGYPPGYGFGYLQILGAVGIPPLWGSNFDTGLLVSRLLTSDWSSFAQFAPLFCPNSPTIVIPPTH
jgi:hypothetical protein